MLLILLVLVIFYIDLRRRFRMTQRLIEVVKRRLSREIQNAYDMGKMWESVEHRRPFPVAPRYAIGSSLCRHLHARVRELKPRLVVELGSGVSTIICCRALEENGEGELVAFEENASYGEEMRTWLRTFDLGHRAEVRHVPLEEGWYRSAEFDTLSKIDLLFIDGPTNPTDRYQSLSTLLQKMSPGGVIVIDDAEHGEMVDVIERWKREHSDLNFHRLPIDRPTLEITLPGRRLRDGQRGEKEMAMAHSS